MPHHTCTLVALTALAFASNDRLLVDAPAERTRLAHASTFELRLDAPVTSAEARAAEDPQAVPVGDFDARALAGSWRMESAWLDAIERSSADGVLAFERTRVALAIDGRSAVPGDEPLAALRFTRASTDVEFDVAFAAPAEPSPEVSAFANGLSAHVTPAHLLPPIDAAVGASWRAPFGSADWCASAAPLLERETLLELLAEHTRDASHTSTSEATRTALLAAFARDFGVDGLDGTYRGIRRDSASGRDLAFVEFECDQTVRIGLGRVSDGPASGTSSGTRAFDDESHRPRNGIALTVRVHGRGELVWDVEGRHLARFELPLALEMSADALHYVGFDEGFIEHATDVATWTGALRVCHVVTRE
jgi:hypothetical protein